MTHPVPKVFAVILNVADTPGLLDCLLSLDKASCPGLGIIVVHNGPLLEGFAAAVRAASAKVAEVLFTGFNSGFAAGNNYGIRRALSLGADYVLLLNDDTAVAPDFLERLLTEAARNPEAGMLGPRILYFSEPERIWFSGARFDGAACAYSFPGADGKEADYGHAAPEETDYMTACAVLVRRELLENIGLLDESYFMYWEDADWGLRASEAGFKSLVVPAAKIWHKVSASSGGADSPIKAYYKARNRLVFAARHAPGARLAIVAEVARDIVWVLMRGTGPDRLLKIRALAAALAHYLSGRGGPAPEWLARGRG